MVEARQPLIIRTELSRSLLLKASQVVKGAQGRWPAIAMGWVAYLALNPAPVSQHQKRALQIQDCRNFAFRALVIHALACQSRVITSFQMA